MFFYFDPMKTAVDILTESVQDLPRRKEIEVTAILEDGESPITATYVRKLYDSVVKRAHIDFDDIPTSKGNIVAYKGYANLIEVLENILRLAYNDKAENVIGYANIIKEAINHMRALAPMYQKGFQLRNEYVMLEYNTFVYTIVQAVSSLLYEFVDYIKRPEKATMEVTLKNTKFKANLFYIEQLAKFNSINKKMQYSKFLTSMLDKGKENFTGVEFIGLAAIVAVALSIIPLTRELVYRYYNTKSNLSDCLAQQAYFLEMNKTVVEANSDFSQKKKDAILIKQEKIKNLCMRLSEKLRVTHIKSIDNGKATLKADNKLLTIDNIKKEISDSPIQLL